MDVMFDGPLQNDLGTRALRSVWEEECKRYLLKKQKAHYTLEKIKQELDKSSEDIDWHWLKPGAIYTQGS